MAELFSRYASGTQFTAGAMVGSVVGTSGLNPIVDRLNSISTNNNHVTGSLISGTATSIHFASGTIAKTPVDNTDITNKTYVDTNSATQSVGSQFFFLGTVGSTSFIDVPHLTNNGSITLNVINDDQTVMVSWFCEAAQSAAGLFTFSPARNGTQISSNYSFQSATNGANHCVSQTFIDQPGSGTYDYNWLVRVTAGSVVIDKGVLTGAVLK